MCVRACLPCICVCVRFVTRLCVCVCADHCPNLREREREGGRERGGERQTETETETDRQRKRQRENEKESVCVSVCARAHQLHPMSNTSAGRDEIFSCCSEPRLKVQHPELEVATVTSHACVPRGSESIVSSALGRK